MPNWDNYIMRKYGGTIRKNIADAYKPFHRAKKIMQLKRLLDNERVNELERQVMETGYPVFISS